MTAPNLAPAMRAALSLAELRGVVEDLAPIVAGLRALKELVVAHEALAEKAEGEIQTLRLSLDTRRPSC
jgi:hypothetical protein